MAVGLEQNNRVYPEHVVEERNGQTWTVPQLRGGNGFISQDFEFLVRSGMVNECHNATRPLAGTEARRMIALWKLWVEEPRFRWPRQNGFASYTLAFAKHEQVPLSPPITNKFVQRYSSLMDAQKHLLVTRVAVAAISLVVSPLLIALFVTTLALDVLRNNEQFFLAYQRCRVRWVINETGKFTCNNPLQKVDPNNSWVVKLLASSSTKETLKTHFDLFLNFVDNIASDPYIQENVISFCAQRSEPHPTKNIFVKIPGWELKYPINPNETRKTVNAREFLEYCNHPERPHRNQRIFPKYFYIALEESYAERLMP